MFEIITVVVPEPKMFFWILLAADVAAVNPSGIKTLLANGLSLFFINGKPVFNMVQEVYQEIFLIILDS